MVPLGIAGQPGQVLLPLAEAVGQVVDVALHLDEGQHFHNIHPVWVRQNHDLIKLRGSGTERNSLEDANADGLCRAHTGGQQLRKDSLPGQFQCQLLEGVARLARPMAMQFQKPCQMLFYLIESDCGPQLLQFRADAEESLSVGACLDQLGLFFAKGLLSELKCIELFLQPRAFFWTGLLERPSQSGDGLASFAQFPFQLLQSGKGWRCRVGTARLPC